METTTLLLGLLFLTIDAIAYLLCAVVDCCGKDLHYTEEV